MENEKMTKKPEILKLVAVALLSTGLLAGCATENTEEVAPTADKSDTMKAGANAAAKNAIYSAKIKNSRAKRAGYEWRDTGKMIKAAEKAAANGDNDKAVKLANAARDQANNAIAQAESENVRFEKVHGTSTLADSGMMSESAPATSTSAASDYTVVGGDNLWNISGKDSVYGNPYQWPLIYKANANKIQDADLIYAGQVFSIPSASSSDVSAAVNHAKTRGAWSIGGAESSYQDYLAK